MSHLVASRRHTRTLVTMLAAMVVAVPASALAETPPPVVSLGPSSSPSGATCRSYSFKIKQNPSDLLRQSVWGQLCYKGSLTASKPVQVLIHGGSYNHVYWDSPFKPSTYSYVKAATDQGYVTLNIDRLGYGKSDRPAFATLNFNVAGYVNHQLVTALRAGSLGPQFSTVILNGHSMGALAAENEASRWKDIDGLIVSGIGHNSTAAGPPPSTLDYYPASTDPKFLTDLSAVGYLTTIPGTRNNAFIAPGTIEPGMTAIEESDMKDTLSPTELVALIADTSNSSNLTFGIQAPVFFANGQYDTIWCGQTGDCNTAPQPALEHTYYSPGVSFTRTVIPDAGHSINTSITAPQFYSQTFAWLTAHGL